MRKSNSQPESKANPENQSDDELEYVNLKLDPRFTAEHDRISTALKIMTFDGASRPQDLLFRSPIDAFEKFK